MSQETMQDADKGIDQQVADAIADLKSQGIGVSGDQSGIYVATAPNGEKYDLSASNLLNLKAAGKLGLEGLQEAHLAKVSTPNLQ